MYSKHVASTRASENPAQNPPMADTLTGRASHRLLDQQGLPKPYGALGESLPPGASNVPHNFHRRSLGENGMLAYTEHAQAVNQRRYQYNFPRGQQPTHGPQPAKVNAGNNGMGRKWASLPKLNYTRDSQKTEGSVYLNSYDFKRPQSDITIHEPISRPNTPVRPASESNGHDPLPYISPRVRRQEYRGYIERTQHGSNVLSLTEEEEVNAHYEDDFENGESVANVEPELKDIAETPVERALKDLNHPNQNIEITPFPGIELNAQPAVIHHASRLKPQQSSKQSSDNSVWTKKGKTSTVSVTINKHSPRNIKVLPDYPLTKVATNAKKHDLDTQRKPVVSPRKPPHYSKQISESMHVSPSNSSVRLSPELDLNEVIVPGVAEDPDEKPVQPIRTQALGAVPIHPSINKETLTPSKNVQSQNEHPILSQTSLQASPNRDVKSPSRTPQSSPVKSEKPKGQNSNSSKHSLTSEELPDIAVTGSKVISKSASPVKDTKPKRTNSTQPVTRKATPVQKPKPAKPPIRIPTGSPKTPQATPMKESERKQTSLTKDSKVKSTDEKTPQMEEQSEHSEAEEEEDSIPELRGVLKVKDGGSKKGKKKSVQFGPKFVREVTKITYPWNEVASSDSDASIDSDEDEEDEDMDSDDNDMEHVIEEMETLISMGKDKSNINDEIEVVQGENKMDTKAKEIESNV